MPVVDDQTRKRWQKGFKRRRKNAAEIGRQADEQIEKFLIGRYERLVNVKRFVFLWTALLVVLLFVTVVQLRALGPYYQTLHPAPGGIFSAGLVGKFSNANPLYATGAADTAVSHLVFSGLLKYDTNNKLVGDLAKDWNLNSNQTRYTVHLRQGLKWHDGKPFTADDVLFTYQMIQNPEAQSALYSSWQGIKVSKANAYTVNFDLRNPLSSFPYSLTNGIVPEHAFKDIKPVQMRSAPFNTHPIGTGPFEWKFVEVIGTKVDEIQQRILLAANSDYWAGRPKLDGFNLTTFTDDDHMISAFNKKQLNAMRELETVPDSLKNDKTIHIYRTPMTSEVVAFFNNSNPILGNIPVRQALVSGVDRSQIPSLTEFPVKLADEPLLSTQLGYDPAARELPHNLKLANATLDKGGWARGADGIRAKSGQHLQLTLAAQDTPEYTKVAQFLQRQWGALGVRVNVNYYSTDDLQNTIIADHEYDILLYGISLGVDPDVFAYWDSSQASVSSQGHLNLSEYKSKTVDQALEGARTRSDPNTRTVKYKIFLSQWSKDAPALALYQPNYIYISRGPIFNYKHTEINASSDQYSNVNEWMIRQRHQSD